MTLAPDPAAYGWAGAGWATVPSDWNPAEDAEKMPVGAIDTVFGAQRPPGLNITVQEAVPRTCSWK